jgi:hypothetical protein
MFGIFDSLDSSESWTFLSKRNQRSEKAGETEINRQLFETEINGQLFGNIQKRVAAGTARSGTSETSQDMNRMEKSKQTKDEQTVLNRIQVK